MENTLCPNAPLGAFATNDVPYVTRYLVNNFTLGVFEEIIINKNWKKNGVYDYYDNTTREWYRVRVIQKEGSPYNKTNEQYQREKQMKEVKTA